ncbi:MAG: glycosyltransferase family 4 protein [Treponema sp.]|nr:glycosyltransferase family 4 protein [Treponema sp.]
MKVGIDTFGCHSGKSGIGSYLLSLIKNLPNSENISFELFGSVIDKYTYNSDLPHITYKTVKMFYKPYTKFIFYRFYLKRFMIKQRYDLIIFSRLFKVCPIPKSINAIAIVNTILSNVLKETKSKIRRNIILKAYKNIKHIITSSEFLKKDLINLGISEDKIYVIPNGIDHSLFYPTTELFQNEFVNIKPFAIKRPYFVYASKLNFLTKKHIELIKAFELFKEKTQLPHRLVLAGSEGKHADSIHKYVAKSKYATDIFITGYFPHASLRELYIGSDACVFPSVAEGVGLPVLEAMACGVPIICSKSGALSDLVKKNIPVLFDSDNIEELANLLEKISTDEDLRKKIISFGLEKVKEYSWKKTAMKTVEVLMALK